MLNVRKSKSNCIIIAGLSIMSENSSGCKNDQHTFAYSVCKICVRFYVQGTNVRYERTKNTRKSKKMSTVQQHIMADMSEHLGEQRRRTEKEMRRKKRRNTWSRRLLATDNQQFTQLANHLLDPSHLKLDVGVGRRKQGNERKC